MFFDPVLETHKLEKESELEEEKPFVAETQKDKKKQNN